MLAEIYIEALLVNEELADQVWELWNAGLITNDLASMAWCILGISGRFEKPNEAHSRVRVQLE